MNGPCKQKDENGNLVDCSRRRPGCHGSCEDYKKYRLVLDMIAKERIKRGVITGYAKEKHTRVMRYFRRAGINLSGK